MLQISNVPSNPSGISSTTFRHHIGVFVHEPGRSTSVTLHAKDAPNPYRVGQRGKPEDGAATRSLVFANTCGMRPGTHAAWPAVADAGGRHAAGFDCIRVRLEITWPGWVYAPGCDSDGGIPDAVQQGQAICHVRRAPATGTSMFIFIHL